MTIIINHAEFHSRATKEPNFKTKTKGYDFSYPVVNTIAIGNIFLSGGTINIKSERQGESIWSFNAEQSILTIERKGKTETHYIDDIEELYTEMSKHYHENCQRLTDKILRTSEKKSLSKSGNKNALKNKPKEDTAKIVEVSGSVRQEFCKINEYNGTPREYFRWVRDNKWWNKLTDEEKYTAGSLGFSTEYPE